MRITGSTSGAGIAASSEVTPSQRATGSIVSPCSDVESSTTKNATWKIVSPCAMPSVTGKVANTIGVAPRRPAQPSISRSGSVNPYATISAASGRASSAVTMAIAVPSGMNSISSRGLTSRPSSRKSASCATHARPSWKVMIVRRAGEEALPITRPGEEDGEEARSRAASSAPP